MKKKCNKNISSVKHPTENTQLCSNQIEWNKNTHTHNFMKCIFEGNFVETCKFCCL